jgi:type II secretory pathway component PulK
MKHAHKQRGAALLMALIIVTLVSTLAAAMVWQQWRAVQVGVDLDRRTGLGTGDFERRCKG